MQCSRISITTACSTSNTAHSFLPKLQLLLFFPYSPCMGARTQWNNLPRYPGWNPWHFLFKGVKGCTVLLRLYKKGHTYTGSNKTFVLLNRTHFQETLGWIFDIFCSKVYSFVKILQKRINPYCDKHKIRNLLYVHEAN